MGDRRLSSTSSQVRIPDDGALPVIDFDKFKPTRSSLRARKRKNLVMTVLIVL
ncbi:MAG: phosphate ABC transporter, permease protein PstA, partial [Bifidobacteriales bacterium]|nr:phosphate ABC transporter, permease protein PstA [Bifidobacteriales bacterium]